MKKIEIVENIITILNWGQENKEYKDKIFDALDGVNWYLSKIAFFWRGNRICKRM